MSVARRVNRIIFWLGLLLLLAGVALLAAGFRQFPGIMLGVALILLAVNVWLGRDFSTSGQPRSATIRGEVVRGTLRSRAGYSDLTIGACDIDRVAQVRYGPLGQPAYSVEDEVLTLLMGQRRINLNVAYWRADLAGNVLWDLDLRASLGNLTLDLQELRLDHIRAHSGWGRLSINAPKRGYVVMELSSVAGEIELILPEGVGARITIERGLLSGVRVRNPRLLALRPDQYSTPEFESSPSRVEIRVKPGAGDLIVA